MGTELPSVDPPAELAGFFDAIAEHSPLPMATVAGERHLLRSANPAFAPVTDTPDLEGKQLSAAAIPAERHPAPSASP